MSWPFPLYLLWMTVLLPATALAQSPQPLGGGGGWGSYPVKFKIQWPTNAAEDQRYWFTNNIYHCQVFSNDGAFSVGNTTLPRTEQRFEPDYTNGGAAPIGEIQYQSFEMAPSNQNSYCVFQIHTGDAESSAYGSTTFMLFWFTNNNGSVRDYSGTQLAANLGNKWFQLNVDHNLANHAIKVWVNQQLVWTQQDNGAGDFYFKDGVYEQSHNPTYEMDTWITNILMWTNSGIAVSTLQPPRITAINLAGRTLTITATNGPAGAQCVLLQSTNVTLPLNKWTRILTNSFDANGNLRLSTNLPNPAAAQFFILSQ
ncbi:MAG TPA: polysaccharide lyase family 7 protein [Verrucomicrobiae bacterium]|nr:polysaccharide lyase family 7 protein [Verrucomicrobiae bacterium]